MVIKPFRFWSQKVLPLVYDDSLSYYEVVCKVVIKLNEVIESQNTTVESVETLTNQLNTAVEQLSTQIAGVLLQFEELSQAFEDFKADIRTTISDIATEVATNVITTYVESDEFKATINSVIVELVSNIITGNWDNTVDYEENDYVIDEGSLWLALVPNTNNKPVEGAIWHKVTVGSELKRLITDHYTKAESDDRYYTKTEIDNRVATDTVIGLVKVDDETIEVDTDGTINAVTATSSSVGMVKPDNTTIGINNTGTLTAVTASSTNVGMVKPDGVTTVVNPDGTISAVGSFPPVGSVTWDTIANKPTTFTPPIATDVVLGGVKIGDGVNVDDDGTISVDEYELPIASATELGGVKVGDGLSIDGDGVLSATSTGGTDAQIVVTTSSDDFVGKNVVLELGGSVVETKMFPSAKRVVFNVVQSGVYTVTCEGESSEVKIAVYETTLDSVKTEVTLTLEGAKEDTITITDSNGGQVSVVVFDSGMTTAEVTLELRNDSEEFTFTSSVAKDTETGTSDYSKTVTIYADGSVENVKIMPEGALYWYGNTIASYTTNRTFSTASGWSRVEPILNTNNINIPSLTRLQYSCFCLVDPITTANGSKVYVFGSGHCYFVKLNTTAYIDIPSGAPDGTRVQIKEDNVIASLNTDDTWKYYNLQSYNGGQGATDPGYCYAIWTE